MSGGFLGGVVVTATIGDRLLLWEGDFVSNSKIDIDVDHRILVAGEKENGVASIIRADGSIAKIPYWANSKVTITGPANADLIVDIVGSQQLERFFFDKLSLGITKGGFRGTEMNVTGAVLDSIDKQSGAGSLYFDGSGRGEILYDDYFDFSNALSVSLRFKPAEMASSLLLSKGSSIKVTMIQNGRLHASVQTELGTYNVVSEEPVELNKWVNVSVDYGVTGLRLVVDGETIVNHKAKGQIVNGNDSILVANNFIGHFDELVLSASNVGAEVSLLGIESSGQIKLDSNGQASFKVVNNGKLSSALSSIVPINIRPVDSFVKSDDNLFFSKAYAQDEGATTYVQIVERDAWFYTVDSVGSFLGGDPESKVGFASNIGGGMLFGIADIGSIVKNTWRATGWSDKEPNLAETGLSMAGLLTELAVGVGEIADLPITVVRTTVASFGDTAFTRTLLSRVKEAITKDVPFSSAENAIIKELGTGNYELAKVFNEVVISDDLYKAAIKSGDHLGNDFLKVFSEIAREPKLGIEPAQHLVKVLSSLSGETLTALKVSPTSLSDSLKGLAKSSGKIAPEVMTKILDNKNLYTNGYKQAELLKDVGELAHVKGFDILADALTIGNKTGLKEYKGAVGFRWELDAAAQLNRAGLEVGEFSRKVANRKDGRVATDIDIILKDGTYIQTKASNSTVGGAKGTAPFGSKAKMTAWVNKARADGAQKIWYIVPKGAHITKGVRDHLTGTDKKELGIDAIISNIILR